MASTIDYKDFVLEQLNLLDNITFKKMMREYLLYYNGILFGGVYDNRLIVKKVESNGKYNMEEKDGLYEKLKENCTKTVEIKCKIRRNNKKELQIINRWHIVKVRKRLR